MKNTLLVAAIAAWAGPGRTVDGVPVTILANVADGASARADPDGGGVAAGGGAVEGGGALGHLDVAGDRGGRGEEDGLVDARGGTRDGDDVGHATSLGGQDDGAAWRRRPGLS